jgi:hypothetical protein
MNSRRLMAPSQAGQISTFWKGRVGSRNAGLAMSQLGLGRVKTKSDLVVTASGR